MIVGIVSYNKQPKITMLHDLKSTFVPMKVSFYFKFSQTTAQKEAGFGTVYYYLMVNNRKTKEKSTKIPCHVLEWDNVRNEFRGKESEARNRRILQIKQDLDRNKLIKEMLGQRIVGSELIEMQGLNQRHQMEFKEAMQNYINEQKLIIRKPQDFKHKGNIEESTFGTYEKRQKNILLFLQENNLKTIMALDVDDEFCKKLETWMILRKCGQAYTVKHIKLVKTVLDYAVRSKIIKVNFAAKYKPAAVTRKQVRTLNSADYEKIKLADSLFTPTERKYVDVLIFMKETFFDISDYREIDESKHYTVSLKGQFKTILEYRKLINSGKYTPDGSELHFITKPRKKRQEENRQIQIIALNKTALAIIEKYGTIDNMPKTSDTCINRYLKMACFKAGIDKNVSTKLGRSSGISFDYNKKNKRGETIALKAGWTSTRELIENYLEIDLEDYARDYLSD